MDTVHSPPSAPTCTTATHLCAFNCMHLYHTCRFMGHKYLCFTFIVADTSAPAPEPLATTNLFFLQSGDF